MKSLFALLVFGVVAASSPSTSTLEVTESNVSPIWSISGSSPKHEAGNLLYTGFFARPEVETDCKYCYEVSASPTHFEEHYFENNSCSGGGNALQLVRFGVGEEKEHNHALLRPSTNEGEGGGCKDCKAFNSCHTNQQSFRCGDRHSPCGATVSYAQAAVRMFDRLTVKSARELAERSAGYLKYIEERGVLASLDCRGKIIGYASVATPPVQALSSD